MLRTQRQLTSLKLTICLSFALALVSIYLPASASRADDQLSNDNAQDIALAAALASHANNQLTRFAGPTSSQPLALAADDALLIASNTDNNSASLFFVAAGFNFRLATVDVGQEPSGVAFLPDGSRAYVADTFSGTVSVLAVDLKPPFLQPLTNIPVGTEPYGLALTPNGRKLYVTNTRSNTVSVIDTTTNTVIGTIENVGDEPRGLAITNDGDDDDNDETVFVTQFLALPRAGGVLDGEDDSKIGLVTRILTATDAIAGTTVMQPIANTGFTANGNAIERIPPGDPRCPCTTGAYPNLLNNIGIKGNFAYLPNTGSSPNGPVRFDVNTQSLLSVIDGSSFLDAGQTINMHRAVAAAPPPRLFITLPWAIAFKNQANEGYVISAASDIVVKVAVNPDTGAAAVQNNPADPTRVLQIGVGKNPRGIVVNSSDTRAYVMNFVSRNISVIDLTQAPEQVIATVRSASLPQPGTMEDMIQIGKELYNTSVGEFDPPAKGQPPIRGRMSQAGWGACSTCHAPTGLTDNVVWIFAAGPRRTIPQHTDFDLTDPDRLTQRALNWSAIFDEEEDFELNIRNVSGGLGLIVGPDGVTPDMPVAAFNPPNANRRQLKVRGVNAWDAIKAFVQFGIRPPISPVPKDDPDVIAGEALFRQANCTLCHGGPQWTSARVRFTPPPPPEEVVRGQLINELKQVGTFNPLARNEVRQDASAPLGADGFAPPSLLSLFAFPKTFFHNGSADSLTAVMNNVTHRSTGTGMDTLTDAEDRRKLIRFLLSIDASTPPIDP